MLNFSTMQTNNLGSWIELGIVSPKWAIANHEVCHFNFKIWRKEEVKLKILLFFMTITHALPMVLPIEPMIMWVFENMAKSHHDTCLLVLVLEYKPCRRPLKYIFPIKKVGQIRSTHHVMCAWSTILIWQKSLPYGRGYLSWYKDWWSFEVQFKVLLKLCKESTSIIQLQIFWLFSLFNHGFHCQFREYQ